MSMRAVVMVACVLLAPSVVEGSPLWISLYTDEDVNLNPKGYRADYEISGWDENEIEGVVTVKSGSLLSVRSYAAGQDLNEDGVMVDRNWTHYRYAGGAVQIAATWTDTFGVLQKGTFQAPIIRSSNADALRHPEDPLLTYNGFAIAVAECCNIWGPAEAEDSWTLGPGKYSLNLAQHLGVQRRTLGGGFWSDIENVQGEPGDTFRSGYGYEPWYFFIDGVSTAASASLAPDVSDVPEPTVLVLGALGVLAALRRKQQLAL